MPEVYKLRFSIAIDPGKRIDILNSTVSKAAPSNRQSSHFDTRSILAHYRQSSSLKRADISMHALEVAFHIERSRLFIS